MELGYSGQPITLKDTDRISRQVAIWCIHFECYKYLNVCNRCRIRIKCESYQDYWSPRFDY